MSFHLLRNCYYQCLDGIAGGHKQIFPVGRFCGHSWKRLFTGPGRVRHLRTSMELVLLIKRISRRKFPGGLPLVNSQTSTAYHYNITFISMIFVYGCSHCRFFLHQ